MADNSTVMDPVQEIACGDGSPYNGKLGLRIASIFIILVTSALGTLFPILTRKMKSSGISPIVYDFAKYFGSGVIIATAFIHLMAPASESLTSECLTGTWTMYPWAQAISMVSVFLLFILEMAAFRIGHKRLAHLGVPYDSHGGAGNKNAHGHAEHPHHVGGGLPSTQGASHQNKAVDKPEMSLKLQHEENALGSHEFFDRQHEASAQILGAVILEFGVIFHSLVIGLTLAVVDNFVTLFAVIIFHQMFEGLGLGSRLSQLPLPSKYKWVPTAAGLLYSVVTPLGIAIGLGVRTTYNPDSQTAIIVSGVLDAFSAGILLYTGLVELLAHDFVFNKAMVLEASNLKLTLSIGTMCLGAGIMALLGRWA